VLHPFIPRRRALLASRAAPSEMSAHPLARPHDHTHYADTLYVRSLKDRNPPLCQPAPSWSIRAPSSPNSPETKHPYESHFSTCPFTSDIWFGNVFISSVWRNRSLGCLDDSADLSAAYGASTFENQITLLFFPSEVDDSDRSAAIPAPDGMQDSFFCLGPYRAPEQLCLRTKFLGAHNILMPNVEGDRCRT
jgi:hypothetical protein